jgi:hypothetical protein
MSMNGHSTHSPKGAICGKCGIEIPVGIGRRYRMKWMHEGCLPLTRLAKIDSYRDENAKLAASELREKRIKEEQEQLKHKLNSMVDKMRRKRR